MKKIILLALTAIAYFMPARIYAQVPAPPPANPDQFWYTSANPNPLCSGVYIDGINTAMIDFPGAKQPVIPAGSLIVSAFNGNGTAGGVCFKDVNSGYTQKINFCPGPDYINSPPDIIVGNDPTQPLTSYIAAVAFYNLTTGLPQINYYKVTYTSAVAFGAVLVGTCTFAPPPTLSWWGSVIHIDVIAETSNPVPATGMPRCNKFVVTWEDVVAGQSFAAIGSLSPMTTTITMATTIGLGATPFGAGKPQQPDVAAIERNICTPLPCAVHDIGIFVTTENNSLGLAYQEYDFTAGAFVTPPTGLTMPLGANANFPRIDAPDDYTTNDPVAFPTLCYFKAAVQIDFGGIGTNQSYVYDNTLIGSAGQDDGWFYGAFGFAFDGPYTPTVAFGGNGSNQYQVSHFLDARSSFPGGTPGVFMEPINKMFPASLTIPDASYIPGGLFYQVNQTPPIFVNGTILNSISTPCNNPGGSTLCAWSDHDPLAPGGPMSTVFYKITPYGGPWGYTFKNGRDNALPPAATASWKVYPSPAATRLTVESPASATYDITDVLGRSVLTGTLQAGSQTINISSLTPGTYIISSFNGTEKEHTTFVKQ
jgi:hypothetical protein